MLHHVFLRTFIKSEIGKRCSTRCFTVCGSFRLIKNHRGGKNPNLSKKRSKLFKSHWKGGTCGMEEKLTEHFLKQNTTTTRPSHLHGPPHPKHARTHACSLAPECRTTREMTRKLLSYLETEVWKSVGGWRGGLGRWWWWSQGYSVLVSVQKWGVGARGEAEKDSEGGEHCSWKSQWGENEGGATGVTVVALWGWECGGRGTRRAEGRRWMGIKVEEGGD